MLLYYCISFGMVIAVGAALAAYGLLLYGKWDLVAIGAAFALIGSLGICGVMLNRDERGLYE